MNKKYSASALVIIILLILRLVGIILSTLLLRAPHGNAAVFFYFLMLMLITLTLFALIGVIRKTRVGLVLTIIISIIDLVAIALTPGTKVTAAQNLGSLLFDLILLFLSINILKRIK